MDNPRSIRFRERQIDMAHGAGGKATRRLVDGLFVPLLFASTPESLGDAAPVQLDGVRIALTTVFGMGTGVALSR